MRYYSVQSISDWRRSRRDARGTSMDAMLASLNSSRPVGGRPAFFSSGSGFLKTIVPSIVRETQQACARATRPNGRRG